ncbi:MAG: methyltransferase domain-containing protein [Dehalococcoidia bacterium]
MPLDRFQSIDPQLLDISASDRVIDLGCGTGRHVLELARQPSTVLGADISRNDLRIGRFLVEIMRRRDEVGARVHWLQTAGERLPFVDDAFDRVICTETLEHVDDDALLARELVRVLKPGGILAVSVPDEYSEKVFWKLSKNYRTHAGGHVRIYERKRVVQLLRAAGLHPYAVRYRHSLETLYWLSHIAFWSDWGKQGPVTSVFRRALDSPRTRASRIVSALDDIGNRILPKSIVVYSRKPLGSNPWPSTNGFAAAPVTLEEETPHEFGTPEHMPGAIAPAGAGSSQAAPSAGSDDERDSVEVRAVPAPFAIEPPAAPSREPGAPPLSLHDELRIALSLRGEEQKRRLIEIMRSCRYALMKETQEMSGEQASTPWTADGRTMKEIIGHITGWERWTTSALQEIAAGSREPAIMSLSGYPVGIGRYGSIDAFNGARMAEARERPWADVLDDSATVFDDLLATIEATPASSLAHTAPFYWPDIGGTVPCGLYLLMVCAHHYQEEHLPEITGSQPATR